MTLVLRVFLVVVLSLLSDLSPAILAATPASCNPFPSNKIYLLNENPDVQIGDFNGDGITDIAALTAAGVTVLFGDGKGTFVSGKTYPAGQIGSIAGFAVGDFNGDGKLDIAAGNLGSTITILLGNGKGGFSAPITSSSSTDTGFLAAADVNGDGIPDLIGIPAVQSTNPVVQVFIGNGNGTFQAPASYSVDVNPSTAVLADFNGDGKLDLAVANAGLLADPGHTISVLLGKGDGTFGPKTDFQVGEQPFGLASGDFNGDGKLDLASANYLDGTTSVLFGNGDGSFQPASNYATGHPFAPYAITSLPSAAGQKPDLVIATLAGTYLLQNKGNGTFRAAQGFGPGSSRVLAADFNRDGLADVALSVGEYDTGSGIGVLLGRPQGGFASSTAYPALPNLSAIASGDFNGDGVLDLVVSELDSPYQFGVMLDWAKAGFHSPAS